YFGDSCVSACALNPCQSPATCTRKPGTAHGYMCECPQGHFGPYCEHKQSGHMEGMVGVQGAWWVCKAGGHATGCHCCHPLSPPPDTPLCPAVNYDSCPRAIEANIWWPRTRFGLPAAAPCPKGSVGTAVRHCDEHKGWLPPNLFNCSSLAFAPLRRWAERLARNESVLDPAQSRRVALQLQEATGHTATYFGSDLRLVYALATRLLRHESAQRGFRLAATQDVHFTEVPPPGGTSQGWGTAVRHCDEHKGWLPPNLFNCSSLAFAPLRRWAERLARNESVLDPAQSRRVALQLQEATGHTATYFGSDLRLAYALATRLLRHESAQRGFRLAATQDVHFTEVPPPGGTTQGALLDSSNKRHWELIQQTEGGTAWLLKHFEDYASALAQNMPQTYLSPFTIVTPNI
ncbi:PREDICTED: cadherin EGF LAG seven-pass G-type receptor 2-like, partial [Calidris pugnax]|uniref:cadherin EGF LAG seven-pass G-type receptor 2-like n=1 Tax=Calidris pugnax TaxID=198806 RepID=UPI00071E409F